MKNFVVLGQSNCIMRGGFLDKLTQRTRSNFLGSALLGASPSLIGPYFLTDDFLRGADYCLIDTCVVDATALRSNSIELTQISQYLEWIGHKCRSNGCEPLFLLIPAKILVMQHDVNLALYKSVLNQNRFLYLDVGDFIRREIGTDETQIDSLYVDPSHIGPVLTDHIAKCLSVFFDEFPEIPTIERETTFCLREFSVVRPTPASTGLKPANYKNSLVTFNGVRMSAGDRLEFEEGKILKVHGISVNAAVATAKLRLCGDIEIVKNFSIQPYSKSNCEARIVPIRTTVQDAKGRFSITLAEPGDLCHEYTMQEKQPVTDSGAIELDGLLVERDMKIGRYVSRMPSESWDVLSLTRY